MPNQNPNALFEAVTAKIVAELSEGNQPWIRPWDNTEIMVVVGGREHYAEGWPRNIGAPAVHFGGMNGTMLNAFRWMNAHNFRTNFWISEARLRALGLLSRDRNEVTGEPCPTVRWYPDGDWEFVTNDSKRNLYNIEQVKNCEKVLGLTIKKSSLPDSFELRHKKCRNYLKRLKEREGLRLCEGGKEAAYYPSKDFISIPTLDDFMRFAERQEKGAGFAEMNYWATMWHEVVHWTGNDKRLNRFRNPKFAALEYHFEELVAEIGAATLCAFMGIRGNAQYAHYIKSWIRGFSDQKTAWLNASEAAHRAFIYIIERGSPNYRLKKMKGPDWSETGGQGVPPLPKDRSPAPPSAIVAEVLRLPAD